MAGRGFSVVADEVRALSVRTDEFNEKIGTKLTATETLFKESTDSLNLSAHANISQLRLAREEMTQQQNRLLSVNDNSKAIHEEISNLQKKLQVFYSQSSSGNIRAESVVHHGEEICRIISQINSELSSLMSHYKELDAAHEEAEKASKKNTLISELNKLN